MTQLHDTLPAGTAGTRAEQVRAIAGPCQRAGTDGLAPLVAALQERFGASLAAVVGYGSCLRSGNYHDGLVDFYVVVDSYRRAYRNVASAAFNALLPPNVYYLAQDTPAGRLQCKYAVISSRQLQRGAERWFQTSIWGRFAQPLALVHARDEQASDAIRQSCGAAVVTLLRRALPALPASGTPESLFAAALKLSYGSELRVESPQRAGEIVATVADEYRRRVLAALPVLAFARLSDAGDEVVCEIRASRRALARVIWPVRSALGKLLSLVRLVKACFTFRDAVDYGAWKLHRHTGIQITVTPRLRRHPLVFGWKVLWQLYRCRALR